MSDNLDQGKSAAGLGGKDQELHRTNGPGVQGASPGEIQADTAHDCSNLEGIAYASDTRAVLWKANEIAIALNHPQRRMAHVVAAIALRGESAARFSEVRWSNGNQVRSAQALQACLEFFHANPDLSQREEQRTALPLSSDVDAIIKSAKKLAGQRVAEHHNIEIDDILRAMVERDQDGDLGLLLPGKSIPSLSKLTEMVAEADRSISGRVSGGLEEMKLSVEKVRTAVENHTAVFKNVVSVVDDSRTAASPFPKHDDPMALGAIRTTTEDGVLRLRDIVAAIEKSRIATDLKLAILAGDVKSLVAATASNTAKLEVMHSEIASLKVVCSKVLALTKLVALATAVLVVSIVIGAVVYRALISA